MLNKIIMIRTRRRLIAINLALIRNINFLENSMSFKKKSRFITVYTDNIPMNLFDIF